MAPDEAGALGPPWPKESIPDEDWLYMAVHRGFTADGEPIPGAFRDHKDPKDPAGEQAGMSMEWAKYTTPDETRNRRRKPKDNGVIAIRAGDIKAISDLTIEHWPLDDNRSHTNVFGMKTAEVRLLLLRRSKWVILPDPE